MDAGSKKRLEYKFGFEMRAAVRQCLSGRSQQDLDPAATKISKMKSPHVYISLAVWWYKLSVSVWAIVFGQFEWYCYSQMTTLIHATYLATFFAFTSERVTVWNAKPFLWMSLK